MGGSLAPGRVVEEELVGAGAAGALTHLGYLLPLRIPIFEDAQLGRLQVLLEVWHGEIELQAKAREEGI